MADAKPLKLYRKRYIPSQCIPLDEDTIVKETDEYIVTTWKTIHPKAAFDHGCSCYLLNEGLKVSKFYRPDGTVLYWYCDIVTYEKDEEANSLTAVDLLADVMPAAYAAVENGCLTVELSPNSGTVLKLNG